MLSNESIVAPTQLLEHLSKQLNITIRDEKGDLEENTDEIEGSALTSAAKHKRQLKLILYRLDLHKVVRSLHR